MNSITFDALSNEPPTFFRQPSMTVNLSAFYSQGRIAGLRAAYARGSDLISSAIAESSSEALMISTDGDAAAVAASEARVELTRHILKFAGTCKWDDRASEQRGAAAIRESLTFLSLFPLGASVPKASAAPDGVVSFEWEIASKKAIAMFEGDGEYGYALCVDGRFRPGREVGDVTRTVPHDLTEYLAA